MGAIAISTRVLQACTQLRRHGMRVSTGSTTYYLRSRPLVSQGGEAREVGRRGEARPGPSVRRHLHIANMKIHTGTCKLARSQSLHVVHVSM